MVVERGKRAEWLLEADWFRLGVLYIKTMTCKAYLI
jgi:hypothetical protein